MRIEILLLTLLIACRSDSGSTQSPSSIAFLDTLKNLRHIAEGRIEFKLTEEETEQHRFHSVDSLFYEKYMSNNNSFPGFNSSKRERGGADCFQYYYGVIENRKSEFTQVLILQTYVFNDVDNTLFLLTYDNQDSLKSILPVASLIYSGDQQLVYTSTMDTNKTIIKYEVAKSGIPDEVDTVNQRLLYCTDSITLKFSFAGGDYTLAKKDSIRKCVWKHGI
jgi:hypothetical protein